MLKASDVVTVTSSWHECMHATVVKGRPQLGCTYLGWHDFSTTGSKQVFSTVRSAKSRSMAQLKHVGKEMSNLFCNQRSRCVTVYLFTLVLSQEADNERLSTTDTGDEEMWHLGVVLSPVTQRLQVYGGWLKTHYNTVMSRKVRNCSCVILHNLFSKKLTFFFSSKEKYLNLLWHERPFYSISLPFFPEVAAVRAFPLTPCLPK